MAPALGRGGLVGGAWECGEDHPGVGKDLPKDFVIAFTSGITHGSPGGLEVLACDPPTPRPTR